METSGILLLWRWAGELHELVAQTWIYELVMSQSELLVIVPLILLLERWRPAAPDQPIFSLGLVQDFVWGLFTLAMRLTLIAYFLAFLRWGFDRYLDFLNTAAMAQLPDGAQLVLALVILDFLGWLHHYLRHRVQWMWRFHQVHHSQRELNMFTDVRYHVVDYLVAHAVMFIPVFSLGLELPALIGAGIVLSCWTKLTHANVRCNFGILRFILVTPQSHRVHHSIEREHFDSNFGVVLSIWDHLLGTQLRRYDVYPPTGIPDKRFPLEMSRDPRSLVAVPLKQLWYPFSQRL